jgi:hypothetical protein
VTLCSLNIARKGCDCRKVVVRSCVVHIPCKSWHELQVSSMQHCVDFEQFDKVLLGFGCWQSPFFGCSQMLVISEAT